MAKVHIKKTVEVCDFCRNEGFLQKCIRCGRSFCLSCDGIICGCWVKPKTCRECSESPEVIGLCDDASPAIGALIKKRDQKIAASGRKAKH